MNHTRERFAHARGARIEFLHSHRGWIEARYPDWFETSQYRIHHDDAHLAYGPLSSALIELATTDGKDTEWHQICYAVSGHFSNWRCDQLWPTEWGSWLLFLAEQLADEGM